MKRLIREGEEIPNWYGMAYYDHSRCYAVCYPLGIHWLVSLWLAAENYFRRPLFRFDVQLKPDDIERQKSDWYERGYQAGYNRGYLVGRDDIQNAIAQEFKVQFGSDL